jgi:hypothetical protein
MIFWKAAVLVVACAASLVWSRAVEAQSAAFVREWNWGRTVDRRCLVADMFGKLAPPRWVDGNATPVHVWRPGQPF